MVVVLHGAGADEAMPLTRADHLMERSRNQHGYILVSPLATGFTARITTVQDRAAAVAGK